jgi:DNA-binding NarL/FixJ family response regulator
MQAPAADEQAFALAVQKVRQVRDNASELRKALESMRSSAERVQLAHRTANAMLFRRPSSPGGEAPGTPQGSSIHLSPRSRAILLLIADGLDNEEIAERLNFGHGTIKLHVRGILAKFGTSSRTVAAVRAVRLGII